MNAPSRKRKLADDTTSWYYAVRAGHQPGIYNNWNACSKNITGFSGAVFKKFSSESEAQNFVAGKPSTAKATESEGGPKFYAVAVGHRPGVYADWGEAQKQIQGVKGPKYKKFCTKEQAEDFVKNGRTKVVEKEGGMASVDEPAKKRSKTSKTRNEKGGNGDDDVVSVWTDGSSRGNGKAGAVAGVGVYFGKGDTRNISEALSGQPQTNNRAELTALIRALEIVPKNQALKIFSDSSYSINCVTVWYTGWVSKGWVTSTKKSVENKDLIITIRELVDERTALGAETAFEWIKGHVNHDGNVQADKLAVEGALKGAGQRRD